VTLSADQPTKPLRTWRPMAAWTAGRVAPVARGAQWPRLERPQ